MYYIVKLEVKISIYCKSKNTKLPFCSEDIKASFSLSFICCIFLTTSSRFASSWDDNKMHECRNLIILQWKLNDFMRQLSRNSIVASLFDIHIIFWQILHTWAKSVSNCFFFDATVWAKRDSLTTASSLSLSNLAISFNFSS